jgi:putative DNA methylase
MSDDRRLIEDYLPVEALNEIAGKEKKHPKHPVAMIHYWPARRPITASRAAIYAALVPAPDSDAARLQKADFVANLASFDVVPHILAIARDEILSNHSGCPPKVLDMFAGGGAIPLEASRLGCESHALDYSPIAHLIELCTLVYPQRYGFSLAADVENSAERILKKVVEQAGDLYPDVTIPPSEEVQSQIRIFGGRSEGPRRGQKYQPVTYIWARTVPCRKPGCEVAVPLVRQAWLRKKGGFIAAVPQVTKGSHRIDWKITCGAGVTDDEEDYEQTGAGEAACPLCTTPVSSAYVKECAIAGRLGTSLAAVAIDAGKYKLYLPAQHIPMPSDSEVNSRLEQLLRNKKYSLPTEPLIGKLTDQLPNYGFATFDSLFTRRQLYVLSLLSSEIREAHQVMLAEGLDRERAKAISLFHAMAFSRLANSFTAFSRWQGQDQKTIAAIGDRQALKMVYDFSEINPFADTAGCLDFAFSNEVYCIKSLAVTGKPAQVVRGNAEALPYEDETFDAIVTDPPYYSSIFYSDLSAFFYVWHKRTVGDLFPEHFSLPIPPKRREAVAQASEHGGDSGKADEHYSTIMQKAFQEARRVLKPGGPLVCVYAHKTAEGWASLIKALVPAGLTVTEAWPIQTEARGRTNSLKAASLSDSIFFVARKRLSDQVGSYEATVRPALERIARERVAHLWAGGRGLGGADLLMAAVGAGLRPFTEFSRVEYANGETVSAERFIVEVEGVVLDNILGTC